MPDALIARSALRPHVATQATAAGEPGVTLREISGLTLAQVSAFRGRDAELSEAVRSGFGIELPATPKAVSAGEAAFVWAGPGKWLAVSSADADFEALPAAVTDQSDGRTVLEISGPRARELLATLIQIDLDPNVFASGNAAVTHAASISVHLWRAGEGDVYRIACFRTFAATLWRWIVEAGRARGIDARLDG